MSTILKVHPLSSKSSSMHQETGGLLPRFNNQWDLVLGALGRQDLYNSDLNENQTSSRCRNHREECSYCCVEPIVVKNAVSSMKQVRLKLEVVVIVICEQAGIYSRIEREVFGGRIENDGRLWRMRENKEEENS